MTDTAETELIRYMDACREANAAVQALEDECEDLRRKLASSDASLTAATAEILRLRALVPNGQGNGQAAPQRGEGANDGNT